MLKKLAGSILLSTSILAHGQTLPIVDAGYFDSLGLDVLSTAILLPVGIAGDAPVPGMDIVVSSVNDILGPQGIVTGLAVPIQGLTGGPLNDGLDGLYTLFGEQGVLSILLQQSPLPLPVLGDQSVLGIVGLADQITIFNLGNSLGGALAPLSGLTN